MQEIYQDEKQVVYAVMRDDNRLMAIDGGFLLPQDYQYEDYRTSPSHWQRYNVPIPSNCRVVKVHRVLTVSVSEV